MKATTIITAVLALVLAFTSCRKKDNPPKAKQTYLSRTIASSSTTIYQYGPDNRVISSTVDFGSGSPSNYGSTFTYNSAGQLTEWFIDNSGTTADTKLLYSYNGSGKISETKTFLVSGSTSTLYRTVTPNYTTEGKISMMTLVEGDLMPYKEYDYFLDSKGNVTKRIQYGGLGSTLSIDEYLDYDDKNSPGLSIPKTNVTSSPNNFHALKQTNSSGAITNTTYTFELDTDGYPTKRTSSSGAIVTYEYIKK